MGFPRSEESFVAVLGLVLYAELLVDDTESVYSKLLISASRNPRHSPFAVSILDQASQSA